MPPDQRQDDPEPIAVETAVRRLDDAAFVDLVAGLWERRGWTVESRTPDGRCVDLLLRKEWPENRVGLVRVVRPSTERPVSGADIEHVVGAGQREDVDWSRLVAAEGASNSVRARGEKYDVEVIDGGRLAREVERAGAHGLVARHVDAPVAGEVGLTLARLGTRLREAIEGHGSLERGLAVLRRSLLAGLAGGDVDRLVFVGFRVAYVVAAALFGVMFAADTGSVGFWLLLAAFLLVVYAGLLPLMAADIYLVRTAPGSWAPTWRYLASFLLAPLPLAAGAVYWYRRRTGGADDS